MIMQSIDYCEGNVLQLISLRQLIIVQLDIEYDMQLFHNFFQRLQPKIIPRLIQAIWSWSVKLKKLIELLFFLENESRYFESVGVNRESLI